MTASHLALGDAGSMCISRALSGVTCAPAAPAVPTPWLVSSCRAWTRSDGTFPLTIVAGLPHDTIPVTAAACLEEFFDAAERLLVETMALEQIDFDRFDQAVAGARRRGRPRVSTCGLRARSCCCGTAGGRRSRAVVCPNRRAIRPLSRPFCRRPRIGCRSFTRRWLSGGPQGRRWSNPVVS